MTNTSAGRTPQHPKYLLLGEILRPHGVRGELRMRVLTDFPERIASLERLYIGKGVDDPNPVPYVLQGIRFHQEYGLLKLKTVDDRNAAELFRELFVMVDLEHAVPLEDDEFYLYELIGLTVRLDDDSTLGTLTEVLETGANDVYVVDSPAHGEVLIPALDDVVLEIDIEAGWMRVRLPEGLIPN
ncbi:MAG: ribosome maturation factor RimM [bacterium]|nr:ribosome maturation factor RimM [bacterium]